MNRVTRNAAAAVCVAALVAAPLDPAGAATFTRDTKRTIVVEENCKWEVDEKGTPIIDGKGDKIPLTDRNGNQICTEREVSRSSASSSGSSETWADDTTAELSVGAIVGIVGAMLAALVGLGMVFIESVDISPLPR